MNILLIMIPLSVLLVIGGAIAFFWAVNNDQFEDMESPAHLPVNDQPDFDSDKQAKKAGLATKAS
ncbi:MAG: cbb3-type cytochrome oxidase assembly protein CcoS [Oceanococcus sp.]